MKITNPETIESSKKELIDFINSELDWSAVEKMILEKHKLQLQDEVVYKHGDIVVYDEQIAYQLDFDVKVSMSLIFNRQGDCLDMKTPDDAVVAEQKLPQKNEEWSKMASNIAEMIHDINQDS